MRDQPINSVWYYQKLRPFVKLNEQANVATLNATNYYKRLEKQYSEDDLQSLQKKQRAFKIFREKLDEQLKAILQRRQGEKECEEVKMALERRYSTLESKMKQLRKVQSEAEVTELSPLPALTRDRFSKTSEEQLLHEEIQEELLSITAHLKRYAKDINKSLEQDEKVIEDINRSQDANTSALSRSTKTMKDMMRNPQLGFFQLLFMAAISIVAFLVTSMFIIIV